ncbi:predicted protein [Plenodomus lingam JN3]|uniref:Predicted protein n=1 Tax=Leptosphaeria maculans (strain JN3 / isolate v23.1.3 / race Av1-4-5-6-7-8) TaxID=985895 RepID=E5AB75_LEPMJ|nr:predicted protein [Plenodomus lingam JN3]CBY00916.1 predicted protein [Plenodomus lingam JN3]
MASMAWKGIAFGRTLASKQSSWRRMLSQLLSCSCDAPSLSTKIEDDEYYRVCGKLHVRERGHSGRHLMMKASPCRTRTRMPRYKAAIERKLHILLELNMQGA